MNIYTSYFSNYKNLQQYQCISIANSKPKSLLVPEFDVVKPNWQSVMLYKKELISYKEFEAAYISQLETLLKDEIELYLKHFNQSSLVLLCWEKDYSTCHRKIFAHYLDRHYDCFNYKGEI